SAIEAMFLVAGLFAVTYVIGYWRHSKRILESIESHVFAPAWYQRAAAWVLNLCVLRHPFRRASFHFIGQLFSRSSKHRLFLFMPFSRFSILHCLIRWRLRFNSRLRSPSQPSWWNYSSSTSTRCRSRVHTCPLNRIWHSWQARTCMASRSIPSRWSVSSVG